MPHSALPPAEDLKLVQLADIARGGMGMVQLCRVAGGRLGGQFLAVKRLNPAIEQEPEFVNMFLDETWITATINSPHVVKVESWGRDEYGLYLAVELVQGVSLSRLMKESKEMKEPFAERTVAFIMSQVCAGLAAAHGLRAENGQLLGLVHRDLTPGNILVGFDGLVKIADFGIAKAEERLTSTRIGMMKGKPAYMAPEQARGGGIDGRADLFAMGVVMFELLAGTRPWTAKNDLETLIAVSTQQAPELSDIRKVSPVLSEIVTRCLKKVPGERFASADEIRERMDGWRRERGFDRDDQASLAAFVVRNTQQQQQWFQQALSGGLRQGGMTFSDLEARIDAGRKKTSGPQASPPQPSGPLGARPAPAAGVVAAPVAPSGQLDDIDENAQTRFMGASPAAGATPSAGAPSSSMGSTVAFTPEEAAKLALAPPSPAAGSPLPLPPRRSPAVGERAHSPPVSGFGPPSSGAVLPLGAGPISGPAISSGPFSPGPISPLQSALAPVSGPVPSSHDLGRASDAGLGHAPAPVWAGAERRSPLRWVALVVLVLVGVAAAVWFFVLPRYGIRVP